MKRLAILLRTRAWQTYVVAGFTGLIFGSLLGCALILWSGHRIPGVFRDAQGTTRSAHCPVLSSIVRPLVRESTDISMRIVDEVP